MPRSFDRLTRRDVLAAGALLLVAGPAAAEAGRLLDQAAAAAPDDRHLQRFVSRPDLQPPVIQILQRHETAPGYVLVAPSSGPGQHGAMIYDNAGELVWFHPVAGKTVTDFKVQTFHGGPVLTWWEGRDIAGLGEGEWVVVDSSYHELARFSTKRGLHGDLHEFVISPQNTALVTSNEVIPWDLRPVRGRSNGLVVGGVVQELALPSGRLLWEWRSLEHVPVAETAIKAKPGPRFDYFHINSIDVAPDGHLIVSGRNTWAAYKLDRRTGRVLWRLGGKRSDFAIGPGAHFEWQHDVREHPNGTVSIFDNAAAPQEEPQSRALVLELDTKRKRATLVHAYIHRPERVLSHFLGNVQVLENGGAFVGWGGSPYMTEFTQAGAIAFDARLPRGGQSYRAFRFPWTGRPTNRPALSVREGTAYASWNGATEVASWQLLEGAGASDLRKSQTVSRSGFETRLTPTAQARALAVAALDSAGATLGTSATVRV